MTPARRVGSKRAWVPGERRDELSFIDWWQVGADLVPGPRSLAEELRVFACHFAISDFADAKSFLSCASVQFSYLSLFFLHS